MSAVEDIPEIVWAPDEALVEGSNLQAFMTAQGYSDVDALLEAARVLVTCEPFQRRGEQVSNRPLLASRRHRRQPACGTMAGKERS